MRLRARQKGGKRFWVCTGAGCRVMLPYAQGATAEVTIEACQSGRLQCWSCPHKGTNDCFLIQSFDAAPLEKPSPATQAAIQQAIVRRDILQQAAAQQAIENTKHEREVDDKAVSEPTRCPKCGSTNIHRQEGKGQQMAAGWYVCFGCWYKWDGVRANGLSLVAPGIVPRVESAGHIGEL